MKSIFSQTAEIYDEYVKYYNNAGNSKGAHISIYSEFLAIEPRVKDFKVSNEKILEECYRQLLHSLNNFPKKELLEKHPDINLEPFKVKLMDAIKAHELNHSGKNHIFSFHDLDSLLSNIVKIYEGIKVRSGRESLEYDIFELVKAINKVNHCQRHITAIRSINYRILDEFYPAQLLFYKELTNQEQLELKSEENKVGAPLRKEVPQIKIKQIVRDLLEIHEQGEKVVFSNNGKKMMFQIVHEDDRYKGRANINQIFKYFEHAHPNLLVISDRQFKERIKKAVPEGMK